jgi:hypothetical protein
MSGAPLAPLCHALLVPGLDRASFEPHFRQHVVDKVLLHHLRLEPMDLSSLWPPAAAKQEEG